MVGTRRLAALATALGVAVAGSLLALAPVQADTGDITYTCTIPDFGTQDIDVSLSTDAPATMVIGETFMPTLRLTVVVPGLITFLAQGAGYTHASAAGTLGIGINGTSTTLAATYPRTKIPYGQDFPVVIDIPLPQLAPTSVGMFRYTPGPLNAQLSVFKGEDDQTADSIQADCVVKDPAANPVIDTVTVTDGTTTPPAKTATTTSVSAPKVAYGRAGKVTVSVSSGSASATGGSVTLTGGGAGSLGPVSLAGGKVVFTLPRTAAVRTYALTATYSGTSTLAASSKNFSFTVTPGTVAGMSLSVTKKPTSKKTGTGKVVVTAPAGLATPTGTVTLVLKKGATTKSVTVTLRSGARTAVLPKLAKGTWSVKVKYSGSSTYRAVTSKAFTFRVTR